MNTKHTPNKKQVIIVSVSLILLLLCSSSFATTFVGVQSGTIYHAYVDYNDVDTVNITAGYGECNGHYWEIPAMTEYDLTSLASGEDLHYIYIDDVNSDYPEPEFLDSTTEPAWIESKLGWYNGNNRCIGVVWSPDSSTTILQFSCNSKGKYWYPAIVKTVLTNGNPNESWQEIDASAYIPVNAISVNINAHNSDLVGSGSTLSVQVGITIGDTTPIYDMSYYSYALVIDWLDIEDGGSKTIKWYGYDNDDNYFTVRIHGYQIAR